MKILKSSLLIVMLSLLALIPNRSKATHFMGVDITYQCIGSCSIRVELRIYRDCSGSSSVLPTAFTIATPIGCAAPVALTPWSAAVIEEVTPICPSIVTCCDYPALACPAGIPRGVQEYFFTRDYSFCSTPPCPVGYTLSWSGCCRNEAITSLIDPDLNGLATNATTYNPSISPCNSSPHFLNPPVPFICAGQPYTFNQGATDADGDSLSYFLGPCLDDGLGFPMVTYDFAMGFSPGSPMGPDWIVTIDSITGDVTMLPNPASATPGSPQVGVMCVYVEEYRDGVLIGTVVRDIQISAVPCSNDVPEIAGISSIIGGTSDGFKAFTCTNDTLCITFDAIDSNPGDTLTVFWNGTLAPLGGTFFSTASPLVTDTIRGLTPVQTGFCWVPTTPGYYSFLITVRDNACPYFGQNQYTVSIYVSGPVVTGSWLATTCTSADFCITSIAGNDPYTWSWAGAGGLSTTDSCFTYTYPFFGSYPFTLTVVDSTGCTNFFRDTVVFVSPYNPDAGPDTAVCSGTPVVLGGPPIPLVTYNWFPAAGLSSTTDPNPTLTLTNTTTAPITTTYYVAVSDSLGCLSVDSMQFTVNPFPISGFNMPSEACVDEVVAVTFTGTAGAGASYAWDFGPTATPTTATGLGPHNVSWSTPGMAGVTLQVVEYGCTSSVFVDSIRIKPIPVALILPVPDTCVTDSLISFTNMGTYGPTASFLWQFGGASIPGSTLENPSNILFTSIGTVWTTLTVTDEGCVSPEDSISFNIYPLPDPNFNVMGGGFQCFDENIFYVEQTGANLPSATYSWDFESGAPSSSGATMDSVSFLSPGYHDITLTVTQFGCTSTLSDSVYVAPNPVVDAGLAVSFCEGEGGAQLNATITGASTSPYYFEWWCAAPICALDSVFDNDPIANPDATTMYYVQVTDFNGCTSNIDSVLVIVIPKPIVDAGPDLWLCDSPAPCEMLTPSVSGSPGPFSYQWIGSIGLSNDTIANPCARPDTTTIYSLTVTDLTTGCTSEATTTDTLSSVTVHVNPVPLADAGPDRDLCLGDTLMLLGIGSGAGPVYDYEWSPFTAPTSISANNIPNPLAFPNLTTDYVLVVWSNGCPSFGDTVTVNVHTNPTVDAGPDRDICQGESVLIDASTSGDPTSPTYSYVWSPAATLSNALIEDPIATPHTSTVYYVQSISAYGCESPFDSVLVQVKSTPIADAGLPIVMCIGDSVVIPASYSYDGTTPADPSTVWPAWTPALNINDTTLLQPTVWPTSTGFYYIALTHNTCVTYDSVLITVLQSPEITLTADTMIFCEGLSTGLHASGGLGGASFTWTPPTGLSDPTSTDPIASPTSTTTYTVTLSEAGCLSQDSITLQVIPTPDMGYFSSQNQGCAPLTVSFMQDVTDAISYSWNFGDGSAPSNELAPVHVYEQPGTYVVTLTASNVGGCEASVSSIVITVSDPGSAEFTADPSFPVQLTLPSTGVQFTDLSDGAISWVWTFGDGSFSSERHPSHLFQNEGEYTVTLTTTDATGCVSTVSHGPFIIVSPDLFIPNVFSPNDDGINDLWSVRYNGSQPLKVNVQDRWGVQVFTTNNRLRMWDGKDLTGAEVPDGVYFYHISIGDKEYTGNVTLVR
jgi:gliding motility-associated-like protein